MARQVNDNTTEDVKQMRELLTIVQRRVVKIKLKGDP
jgi:hypothetical protein